MIIINPLFKNYLLGLSVLLAPVIANAQWCNTNLYTAGCSSFNDCIESFSTTGGVTDITNNNTGCTNLNGTGYSYYSGTGKTHTALAGTTGNFSFTNNSSYSEYYGIWIDFDNDGNFTDPGEQVYASGTPVGSSATINGTFTVPPGATPGTSRLRIRCDFAAAPTDCGNSYEGEGEDYDFIIISPDCDPPTNFQFANIGINSADVSWDPVPNAMQYEYILDKVKTDPTSSGYNFTSVTNLSFTGLEANTCYYLHMRTVCGSSTQNPESSWVVDSFCTIPGCDPPVVTMDQVTSTTAIARWDGIFTAFGYEYAVSVLPTPPTQGTLTAYTNVKLMGLEANKPWYFHVRSRCSPTPLSDWTSTPFHTEATLSIDDANTANWVLNAYPNPVKDMLRIEMMGDRKGIAHLSITDIAGRVVKELVPGNNKIVDVDLGDLRRGIYLLRYRDDERTQIVKLLKE